MTMSGHSVISNALSCTRTVSTKGPCFIHHPGGPRRRSRFFRRGHSRRVSKRACLRALGFHKPVYIYISLDVSVKGGTVQCLMDRLRCLCWSEDCSGVEGERFGGAGWTASYLANPPNQRALPDFLAVIVRRLRLVQPSWCMVGVLPRISSVELAYF